ncbi:MAG: putative acetyltransferase [Mariniblastus sp.]|jgi:putative acetyltransferase
MTKIIRQYEDRDLDSILECFLTASKVAHPFLSEAFLQQELINIPNLYLPNTDTWVAETEGQVVGFIALMGNEVGAIFACPEHHGTGVGWALMNKARELHDELEVEVFKANSIGRQFYERCGFEQIEEKMHEPTGNELLRLKLS